MRLGQMGVRPPPPAARKAISHVGAYFWRKQHFDHNFSSQHLFFHKTMGPARKPISPTPARPPSLGPPPPPSRSNCLTALQDSMPISSGGQGGWVAVSYNRWPLPCLLV